MGFNESTESICEYVPPAVLLRKIRTESTVLALFDHVRSILLFPAVAVRLIGLFGCANSAEVQSSNSSMLHNAINDVRVRVVHG